MALSYAKRLSAALDYSGLKRTTFRVRLKDLAKAKRMTVPTGERQIAKFFSGATEPQTIEFSELAAEILRVRCEWLYRNDGEMTAPIIAMSTLNATAPVKIMGSFGALPSKGIATAQILRGNAKPLENSVAGLAAYGLAWDRAVDASPTPLSEKQRLKLAATLWDSAASLVSAAGVDPFDAPESTYIGIFAALITAIDHNKKRPR